MSRKNQEQEIDKSQRIKKHVRHHSKKDDPEKIKRIKPNHKPAKKQHINILDAYEKYGDDYDDLFE